MRVDSDTKSTRERRRRLAQYMVDEVMSDQGFHCSSASDCRSACSADAACAPDFNYWEGQASYIGSHYDLAMAGVPLRVAMIGKDYGRGPALVDLDSRSRMVMAHSVESFRDRTPHVRGIAIALRQIFAIPLAPTESAIEWLTDEQGTRFHIFDAFALVNALLCTCARKGSATSEWRSEMRRACQRHLSATLDVLDPTLVIVQGTTMTRQPPLKALLSDREPLGMDQLFTAELPSGHRAVVCDFSHPYQVGHQSLAWSRPGTDRYIDLVVAPALEQALTAHGIVR